MPHFERYKNLEYFINLFWIVPYPQALEWLMMPARKKEIQQQRGEKKLLTFIWSEFLRLDLIYSIPPFSRMINNLKALLNSRERAFWDECWTWDREAISFTTATTTTTAATTTTTYLVPSLRADPLKFLLVDVWGRFILNWSYSKRHCRHSLVDSD